MCSDVRKAFCEKIVIEILLALFDQSFFLGVRCLTQNELGTSARGLQGENREVRSAPEKGPHLLRHHEPPGPDSYGHPRETAWPPSWYQVNYGRHLGIS